LGKSKYKVIVLPNVETIPVDTYRKFEEFARANGVLIATKRTPSQAPGFRATDQDHQQVASISKGLFDGSVSSGRLVTNEPIDLGRTLQQLTKPDVEFVPATPEIAFVHRSTRDAEIYFIANTANGSRSVKAYFEVARMKPEWWNPFDGSVQPAKDNNSYTLDYSAVTLDLEPYGSRLLVLSKRNLPEIVAQAVDQTLLDLSTGWRVAVGSGPATAWDKLRSWTDDQTNRYFSGVATYEKDVTIPRKFLENSSSLRLDFGEGIPSNVQPLRNGMQAWLDSPVREAAVVYINDVRAGAVWCPPYSLEVRKFLRPGANKLRILVANTAMNYMAGHSLPDYRLLNLRYGERFQPQDMDKIRALPSGILGPVRLIGKKLVSQD
jgi:hypothetical protein